MKWYNSPKVLRLLSLAIIISACSINAPGKPMPKHGLHFKTPSQTWDEAIPLGNGLLGALVWGDGAAASPTSTVFMISLTEMPVQRKYPPDASK